MLIKEKKKALLIEMLESLIYILVSIPLSAACLRDASFAIMKSSYAHFLLLFLFKEAQK